MAFISQDQTDKNTYIKDIYDCSEFSRDVHNNAEAAGIQGAVVQVKFRNESIGHALNAFLTTDRGLVFVDSTGAGLQISETEQQLNEQANLDKMAYVASGKKLGLISLGKNTPLDYASYEKMEVDWDSYYQELIAYNSLCQEPMGPDSNIEELNWIRKQAREFRLKAQKAFLDRLRAELEPIWEPMGIVESIRIYW